MRGSILEHSLESSPPPLSKTTVGVPSPPLCIHSAYPPTLTFRPVLQSATASEHRNIATNSISVAMIREDALRDKPIEEIVQAGTSVLPFSSIHPLEISRARVDRPSVLRFCRCNSDATVGKFIHLKKQGFCCRLTEHASIVSRFCSDSESQLADRGVQVNLSYPQWSINCTSAVPRSDP